MHYLRDVKYAPLRKGLPLFLHSNLLALIRNPHLTEKGKVLEPSWSNVGMGSVQRPWASRSVGKPHGLSLKLLVTNECGS